MAAVIVYVPKTRKGHELLDELERRTGEPSSPSDYAPDARQYYARGDGADVHAFEPMLDVIAPDWRDHLTLASPD